MKDIWKDLSSEAPFPPDIPIKPEIDWGTRERVTLETFDRAVENGQHMGADPQQVNNVAIGWAEAQPKPKNSNT